MDLEGTWETNGLQLQAEEAEGSGRRGRSWFDSQASVWGIWKNGIGALTEEPMGNLIFPGSFSPGSIPAPLNRFQGDPYALS